MSDTARAPENSWALLYDGRCPMCLSTVKMLERWRLLVRAEAVDGNLAADLPGSVRSTLRSVLVLYNRSTGEALEGVQGLIRLARLHGRFRWITGTLRVPALAALAGLAYRLISVNRRVLSPPPNATLRCDCDPPPRPGYRLALLLVLAAIGLGATALHGASLGLLAGTGTIGALDGALRLAAATGAGWLVNFLLLAPLLRRRLREFVEQSLVVMALGALSLLPFLPLNLAAVWLNRPRPGSIAIVLIALGVQLVIMLRSVFRRSRNLGFPRWVPRAWLLAPELIAVTLAAILGLIP